MKANLEIIVLLHYIAVVFSQKVAPGVPPQHYQPQIHPQQHQVPVQQHQVPVQPQYQQQQHIPQQQQQQQQQYVPQQQQQVPVQQQQQQPPPPQQQQQQPQQHAGHGGHQSGHHNPQLLSPGNIAHEKEHIQEHMDVPIDTSKMTEQELQFHYFKMHDADNNNKLDGCELIKSLIHWHGNEGGEAPTPEIIQTDEALANMADHALKEIDIDNDGFISYQEYRKATDIHT